MQGFAFELDPESRVDIAVYTNVRNGASLVQQLGHIDCALVNAHFVPSLLVVRVAAWKALCDARQGTLTTRNLHSEIVFNLAPDFAISKSLKLFGVSDRSDCLVVCVVNGSPQQVQAALRIVDGTLEPDAERAVAACCDAPAVRQVFAVGEAEGLVTSLQDSVIARITSKLSKRGELQA